MSLFEKLPQELSTEIFTRLTAKTIGQIGCICKSWNALIKNPSFINAHMNRSEAYNKTQSLLITYSGRDMANHFSIRSDDGTFDEEEHFSIRDLSTFTTVGSCNGLICMLKGYTSELAEKFVIWNPTIRKTLHVATTPCVKSVFSYAFGFGFNSRTNDFNVVRIMNFGEFGAIKPSKAEARVYEMSSNSWRASSTVVPAYDILGYNFSDYMVFFRGALHWLVTERKQTGEDQSRYLMLSFDLGSEVCCEMMLPSSVANTYTGCQMLLSNFEEKIYLFHDQTNRSPFISSYIWVMNEYGVAESWTKLCTSNFQSGNHKKVFGFTRSGEILIHKFATQGNEVVSFNPVSKQEVKLGNSSRQYCSPQLHTYMESLFLLDQQDEGF